MNPDEPQLQCAAPIIRRDLPPVSPNLAAAVVIPAFNEPDIAATLASLRRAKLPSHFAVEVFVVVNHPMGAAASVCEQNGRTLASVAAWERDSAASALRFYAVDARDLPERYAGVGSARKIGMDLAAARLLSKDTPGFILNLDADCTVDDAYFEATRAFFAPAHRYGASLYFEHPLGDDDIVDAAIIEYELFLRYYVAGLRWAGHPHAFQTVGSAMAVRADIYLQEGGMNRRKAAEDFYFLQKVIARGGFGDIVSTCVYPSGRPSDRVPFGTGRSVLDWRRQARRHFSAYSPRSFGELQALFVRLPQLRTSPQKALSDLAQAAPAVAAFFNAQQGLKKLEEIIQNVKTDNSFAARFFRWFNLFRCRQFMHFARDGFYASVPVQSAVAELLPEASRAGAREQLLALRTAAKIRPAFLSEKGHFTLPSAPC